MDVACSLQELVDRTGGYVQELHDYLRRYPQPLEALSRAWVETATAVADLADEDANAMAIRYEDLAAEPEAVVKQILEFLGEPWEDGLIQRALDETGQVGFGDWKTFGRPTIDTSSVDRWKTLPRQTIVHLARICNPLLERLGYDAVPSTEDDAEEARRRYELGLLANRLRAEKAKKD
jgi:hypothetical protein